MLWIASKGAALCQLILEKNVFVMKQTCLAGNWTCRSRWSRRGPGPAPPASPGSQHSVPRGQTGGERQTLAWRWAAVHSWRSTSSYRSPAEEGRRRSIGCDIHRLYEFTKVFLTNNTSFPVRHTRSVLSSMNFRVWYEVFLPRKLLVTHSVYGSVTKHWQIIMFTATAYVSWMIFAVGLMCVSNWPGVSWSGPEKGQGSPVVSCNAAELSQNGTCTHVYIQYSTYYSPACKELRLYLNTQ